MKDFLYRFDGKDLTLKKLELTLDEYMKLVISKKLKKVALYDCVVKNLEDTLVSTATLLKHLYNGRRLFV